MSRRPERGVVLVAAVTALALMSALALGLAETTVLDERLAEKSLAALQADALADWTDADDTPRPHGAERDWYLAQAPPLVPRNAPFASVGELALVRGIDAAALARLRPFVAVADEHAVNPNTASREVLLAVVQDVAAVDRLLAERARRPLAAEDSAALLPDAPDAVRLVLTPRGQHYTVRAVGGVGAVRRAVEATLSAPAGVEPEIVAWRAVER